MSDTVDTKKAIHPRIGEALSDSEISERELHERYDAMLNECYSFEKVGGVFKFMVPSRVLEAVDPIAYRCGFNDWIDGEDCVDINGNYHKREELEEALDTLLEEAEARLEELEEDKDSGKKDDIEEAREEVKAFREFINSNL